MRRFRAEEEATSIEVGMDVGGFRLERIASWEPATHTLFEGRSADGLPVLVKVVSTRLSEDREFKRWFKRLARAREGLDAPSVLPMLAWGELHGRFYLVLEAPGGPTLADVIANQAPPPPVALRILSEAAAGVEAGHAAGLIHRGLDTREIWLTGDGHVRIGDFGIARPWVRRSLETVRAEPGLTPEEVVGEDRAEAGDVYCLGCIFVECLTGTPAFAETDPHKLAHAHASRTPPRPTDRLPRMPAAIDDVVARALAKRPEDRYTTPGELAAAAAAAFNVTPPVAASAPEPVAAAAPFLTRDPDNGDTPEPAADADQPVEPGTQVAVEPEPEPAASRDPGPVPVRPVAPQRRRERRTPARGPAGWIAAVAATLLVAGGIGFAVGHSGDSGGSPEAAAEPTTATATTPSNGPEAAWLAAASRTTSTLSADRVAGRAAFAKALTNRGQNRAADQLAAIYGTAADELEALPGGKTEGARLVRALRTAEAAYKRLAAAIKAKSLTRFRAAVPVVERAEAGVQSALVRADP